MKSPSTYHPINKPKNNLRRATFILNLLFEKGMINKKDILSLETQMPKRKNIIPYKDRFFRDLIRSETKKLKFDKGTYRIILSVDPIAQMQALNILKRRVSSSKSLGVARASLVSLAESGAIKAIVGGQNYLSSAYNLATQAERQAASTFKIVTYLAALESGYNKNTKVFDDRTKLPADVFPPRNYDRKYAGEITLGDCFAQSKNVCTVDIATRLTNYSKLSEMAKRLRITEEKVKGEDIVLGATETTLLKNTAAFASIKNEGNYTQPFLIRFVLSEYGYLFHEHTPNKERIFEKQIASQMVELLGKVVSPEGTANSALIEGHETFGKTGTSQRNRDAWFVGFSEHEVTTGIWVGPADDKLMKGVSGGGLPSEIFRQFNENLYERYDSCKSDAVFRSEGYARDINC